MVLKENMNNVGETTVRRRLFKRWLKSKDYLNIYDKNIKNR